MSQKKLKINPKLLEDPTFRLKYIGFCMAITPSLEKETVPISDFVNFAKFQLCAEYGIPLKHDIWDRYTKEDILAEFFALKFHRNEEEAKAFESSLLGVDDDDFKWMTEQVEKNQEEIQSLIEENNDEFKFSPEDITPEDIVKAKEKEDAK